MSVKEGRFLVLKKSIVVLLVFFIWIMGMQASVGFIAHLTHLREMLAMGWLKINSIEANMEFIASRWQK